MKALRDRLALMSPRERRILAGGLIALAITLLWLLHDWQRSTHQRLDTALPRLEAQLAAMQADAAEIARLRSLPPPPVVELAQSAAALQASSTALGLTLNVRSDGNQIIASGQNVSFDTLTLWIGETLRSSGLRLSYLDASQTPAGLNVEARFVPAG